MNAVLDIESHPLGFIASIWRAGEKMISVKAEQTSLLEDTYYLQLVYMQEREKISFGDLRLMRNFFGLYADSPLVFIAQVEAQEEKTYIRACRFAEFFGFTKSHEALGAVEYRRT